MKKEDTPVIHLGAPMDIPGTAWDIITNTQGKIFSATFIKRTDNTVRKMVARTKVTKYLKGGNLAFDPKKRNLITVFDLQKKGYRMVNLENLIEIKAGGVTFTF
jgi:hypothetical protein